MMKFLRSQSQTVLALVLLFIAVGFLFYGNAGNLITAGTAHGSNDYGRIDGQDLSIADLYDSVRDTKNIFRIFGQGDRLQQPGAQAGVAALAWQNLLLEHEADRLHITISPAEIADWIRQQSVFQKDGAFSMDAYNSQMKVLQSIMHVTPDAGVDPLAATKAQFERIIGDYLRTEAVKSALFNSVRSSAKDVGEEYGKLYGPTTVTYVTFEPKTFLPQLKVTPDMIAAEYKNNPTNPAYRTQEQRKVDYVLFMLTPDQQKLPDDQKRAAKDDLGQKALNFVLAFQPDPSAAPGTPAPKVDFMTEAKKENLSPATTDFFIQGEAPFGVPPGAAFGPAAFALTKDDTISKVVELDNGLAVLHLAEIQPSGLRPLAEVKAAIENHLLDDMAKHAADTAAQLSAALLKNDVAKGTAFSAAAVKLHAQPVTTPAFVPNDVLEDPKLGTLAYEAVQMKVGEVSKPFPLPGGDSFAVLHLDSRAEPAPSGLAAFDKRYRAQQDQQLRHYVVNDWVNWKSRQPGTRPPQNLADYGSVE
jgi:hypothetical protein